MIYPSQNRRLAASAYVSLLASLTALTGQSFGQNAISFIPGPGPELGYQVGTYSFTGLSADDGFVTAGKAGANSFLIRVRPSGSFDELVGVNAVDPTYLAAVHPTGTAVGYGILNSSGAGYNNHRAVRWDAGANRATVLGTLGTTATGWTSTHARHVNSANVAVGDAMQFYADGTYSGYVRAVRWDTVGTATALGIVAGSFDARATLVNDAGTVVGYARFEGPSANDPRWRAVRWDAAGSATLFDDLGAGANGFIDTRPTAINDSGTVIGHTKNAYDSQPWGTGLRALRWDPDSTIPTQLFGLKPTTSADNHVPSAINSAGVIVGSATKYNSDDAQGMRPVRWDPGQTTAAELPLPDVPFREISNAQAVAVNAAGAAVGFVGGRDFDAYTASHALYWRADGKVFDLNSVGAPLPSGWVLSGATHINDTGWIVGTARAYSGRGSWTQRMFMMRLATAGDANWDGRIDGADYALLDRGYASGLSGWENGDFDRDGVVGLDDYLIIDREFCWGLAHPPAALVATRELQFGIGYSTALIASVPEPSTVSLAALATVAMARRRTKAVPARCTNPPPF